MSYIHPNRYEKSPDERSIYKRCEDMRKERDELKARVSELKASSMVPDESKHHAVMQAQMWAQEARTQKAIVRDIGKLVGCANDWEMVEAVRDALPSAVVPSGVWQFYQDGEWHTGGRDTDPKINTINAGYKVRDLWVKQEQESCQ